MASKTKLELNLICPQCGSNKIARTTDRIEMYCQKCGTVMEDELIKF